MGENTNVDISIPANGFVVDVCVGNIPVWEIVTVVTRRRVWG